MILPTGGPRDRTEFEIQVTSSLGAPNWMRHAIRTTLPEAIQRRDQARADQERYFKSGLSSRIPEFRIIERTVSERLVEE